MPNSGPQPEQARLLASRLQTLLDWVEVTRGREVQFKEIAAHLEKVGKPLSRSRWAYMIAGTRVVDDVELLDAISSFFDVPVEYLRGEGDVPEKVAASLDLVGAMRVAEVRSVAARAFADLSPETLRAITAFLDEDAARNTAGGVN